MANITKTNKPLYLDSYPKMLLTFLVLILIAAIFAPAIVFAMVGSGPINLNEAQAKSMYDKLIEDYDLDSKTSATFSYSYEDGDNTITQEFKFELGTLVSRVHIIDNGTAETRTTFTSGANLILLGSTLTEIIEKIIGDIEIVGGTIQAEFSLFGLGYSNAEVRIANDAGNLLTFKNGKLIEILVSSTDIQYTLDFEYTSA
jgi:hypothetical protein